MTSNRLRVIDVNSGDQDGTIELVDGTLKCSDELIDEMVTVMSRNRGWTPAEAMQHLNGWSNGYVQIVAEGDPVPGAGS